MKNFKLASFFSALLLGSLSHVPLNAWRIQDHAVMQGLYDNRLTVYFDGQHWRKANGQFLDHRKFPRNRIQNIVNINQPIAQPAPQPIVQQAPQPIAQPIAQPIVQQAPPQVPTQADYDLVRNTFHDNLQNTNINDVKIFNVLYSRCPQLKNDIENMVIPVTNRLGATQEAVDELLTHVDQLINTWQPYQPLIDLIAEMPANSVPTINLHNGLNTLKKIFNEQPDWYDYLTNPSIRAYFKKCIVDQDFDNAQNANNINTICAKIVQDIEIVTILPENILTKYELAPKLFDELINQGKTASDYNTYIQDLEILGEKLTACKILQIENSENITEALTTTCDYIALEREIQQWIYENSEDSSFYIELVHNFFENESMQNFFDTNFALDEQTIKEIISNFFKMLLTEGNASFFEFYTDLVSSISFESIEHLQAVMSKDMAGYFYNHWNTLAWDDLLVNKDVCTTILSNSELCKQIFSIEQDGFYELLNFVKNVIENSSINIKKSSIFLLDNMDVFNQIINFIIETWDDIHNNAEGQQPELKNTIIATLSNLIADLAELYTSQDNEFKDHGFINWIFAAETKNPTEALSNYILNTVHQADDFFDNWPGRARLLQYHKPAVAILQHVALMIGINRDLSPEDLNTYLNNITSDVIPTTSTTTLALLEKSSDIATWVFDIEVNDALNRMRMLDALINNQMFDTITKNPRLTRLIFNKHITTQQDLDAAIKIYTNNDDTMIQQEINIALTHGLYECKYVTKGSNPDPDYDPNYTTYPVEKLFDNGKLKELAEIVAACAGVDGWFYTTKHSNRYLTTAIQTVMSWLLTDFYDKPTVDWTDPNINDRVAKLLNLKTDTSDTNFKFRDSELLHYAVYDNALFDFVMNNPQACIDLSALITNENTTQDAFTLEATRLTQQQRDAHYLVDHLIKIFIYAHTTQDIINDLVSWLGHLKQQKGSPEFNQTLQDYIKAANEEIAKYPNAQQLGAAHIAMIEDILEGEAQEKTIAGRFKAFCRWGQKYHPKTAKIALSGALLVTNGLTTIGKATACISAPQTIIANLATQVAVQTFALMGYKKLVAASFIIKALHETFSTFSFKELKNLSNWTSVFTSLMTNMRILAQKNPQDPFAHVINHGDYTNNFWIQDFVKQLLQAVKQVVMNFIGNNGGWENFYKTATMKSNDIRHGKRQQDIKIQELITNTITNLHYIKIGWGKILELGIEPETLVVEQEPDNEPDQENLDVEQDVEQTLDQENIIVELEPENRIVDPNPEQGPTHVNGWDQNYEPGDLVFQQTLGDNPEALNARIANSTTLIDPESDIVDVANELMFRKDLGDTPVQEGFVQEDEPSNIFEIYAEKYDVKMKHTQHLINEYQELIDSTVKNQNSIEHNPFYKVMNWIKNYR